MTGAKVEEFQSTNRRGRPPAAKPVIGVYAIKCSVTGKSYIGSSKHIHSRLRDHRNRLRRGDHYRKELQVDFSEHGEESFTFEVILECRDEHEAVREEARLIGDSFKADVSYNGIVPNAAEVKLRAMPAAKSKKSAAAELKERYLALIQKNREEGERLHSVNWEVMYYLGYRSAEQFFRCVNAFLSLTKMTDEELSLEASGYPKRLFTLRRKPPTELTLAETGEISSFIRRCMEDRDHKRMVEESAARKSWTDAEGAAA